MHIRAHCNIQEALELFKHKNVGAITGKARVRLENIYFQTNLLPTRRQSGYNRKGGVGPLTESVFVNEKQTRERFKDMLKKVLLSICLLLIIGTTPADAIVPRFTARLCQNCAFGSKKEYCVKCGNWAPHNYSPAGLCNNCGFGSRADYCVKCGKWAANNYAEARLCNNCAFGSKKEYCVKCGKWAN